LSFRIAKYLFLVLLLVCSIDITAQSLYRAGILPGINIGYGWPNGFNLNLKVESRQGLLRGTFGESREWKYDYYLTDIALVASKKLGLNNRIAMGYQVRLRDQLTVHRAIQQFTLVRPYRFLRTAHRFAADESFAKGLSMELRLRYRFTAEIPFSGQAVDAREFYLKVNNEYLNAFYEDEYGLEIRLSPMFGYVFSDNNKLEFGPDYRLATVFKKASLSSFWLSINWYLRL
jgi:hypothetical protein